MTPDDARAALDAANRRFYEMRDVLVDTVRGLEAKLAAAEAQLRTNGADPNCSACRGGGTKLAGSNPDCEICHCTWPGKLAAAEARCESEQELRLSDAISFREEIAELKRQAEGERTYRMGELHKLADDYAAVQAKLAAAQAEVKNQQNESAQIRRAYLHEKSLKEAAEAERDIALSMNGELRDQRDNAIEKLTQAEALLARRPHLSTLPNGSLHRCLHNGSPDNCLYHRAVDCAHLGGACAK